MGLQQSTADKNNGTTIEFETTAKPRAVKQKKDAHKFGGAIACLKEERAEALMDRYKNFINSFMDKEEGGKGLTVHMEYLANDGDMVDALVKKLKAEGFMPDTFTSKGRKIVAVNLALQ